MKTPNMSSIISSLEKDLQDLSLNHHNTYSSSGSNSSGGGGGARGGEGDGGDGLQENNNDDLSNNTSEITYDLNSHISLPYHWEQCLDLQTGELYYINWRTGMKVKEDPRTAGWNDDFDEYLSEDDDSSSYGSEDSSADEESPPLFSRNNQCDERGDVLVVGGCKSCMMYFMVPKQVEDCPKCSHQLLHFDKPDEIASSS